MPLHVRDNLQWRSCMKSVRVEQISRFSVFVGDPRTPPQGGGVSLIINGDGQRNEEQVLAGPGGNAGRQNVLRHLRVPVNPGGRKGIVQKLGGSPSPALVDLSCVFSRAHSAILCTIEAACHFLVAIA